MNNEVVDAVNCHGVTQRSSRCGRHIRRNVFFKFCPLWRYCSRPGDIVRHGGIPMEFDHRFRGGRSRLSPALVCWLFNNQNKLTFFVFDFLSKTGGRAAAPGDVSGCGPSLATGGRDGTAGPYGQGGRVATIARPLPAAPPGAVADADRGGVTTRGAAAVSRGVRRPHLRFVVQGREDDRRGGRAAVPAAATAATSAIATTAGPRRRRSPSTRPRPAPRTRPRQPPLPRGV